MAFPKISIIVPVYNAENYLHRCVDSLLAQTFLDFEILLIDDGSPDESGKICDEYAQKDERVLVFHKENGGVSSARQCGLDHAQGEYVIHVDPDDWVETNMLEELYSKAKGESVDMVICDYWLHLKREQMLVKQHIENLTPHNLLKQLLLGTLHGSCCNKLVRRSCFLKFNIRFPKDSVLLEDLYVICELLYHQISVAYLKKAFYHYDYCTNQNSLTREITYKGLTSQIDFISHFEELFAKNADLLNSLSNQKFNALEASIKNNLLPVKEFQALYPEAQKGYGKVIRFNGLLPLRLCTMIAFKHYGIGYNLLKLIRKLNLFKKKILE